MADNSDNGFAIGSVSSSLRGLQATIIASKTTAIQIPVKYIGVGEKIEQLQVFNRLEFVDSLFPEQ